MLYDDTKYFKNEIYANISELVNRILRYNFREDDKIHSKVQLDKKSTLKTLSQDKNFLSCVTAVKQNFDYRYNNFMNNLYNIS